MRTRARSPSCWSTITQWCGRATGVCWSGTATSPVIGEAADAATAYALFRRLNPQIVVMDITLPGTSGIEAMRRMLTDKPGTRVLIFSMHEDAIFAKRALQAGAFGYVTKASAPTVLVEAVHSVAGGRKYLSAEIAHKLALRDFAVDESAADGLSAREFEVLRQLAQGKVRQRDRAGDGTQSENHFQSSIRHQTEAWSRYRHSAV